MMLHDKAARCRCGVAHEALMGAKDFELLQCAIVVDFGTAVAISR